MWKALGLLRVEAGVPRYGQDMVDTTIPLEANLTHAISYNKGCYIGQEVIARATFRGHMNSGGRWATCTGIIWSRARS